MVWSEWIWVHTNIPNEYYVGRPISISAAGVCRRMFFGVSHRRNYALECSTIFSCNNIFYNKMIQFPNRLIIIMSFSNLFIDSRCNWVNVLSAYIFWWRRSMWVGFKDFNHLLDNILLFSYQKHSSIL